MSKSTAPPRGKLQTRLTCAPAPSARALPNGTVNDLPQTAGFPIVKFVVASGFYAGLGFALRLQDEGHDVVLAYGEPDDRRRSENYHLVGNGLVEKRALRDVIADRARYRDWRFIWDENHSVDANELLRSE